MRDKDPYPEIGRILVASAPASWQTIVLTAQVGDDWAKFRAVDVGSDGQQRGISLQQVARLRDLFLGLRATTRLVAGPGKPDWTTATFTLRRDGAFDVDFGYA
jgi:hypothetical protein